MITEVSSFRGLGISHAMTGVSSTMRQSKMSEVDTSEKSISSREAGLKEMLSSGFTTRGDVNACILELEKTSPYLSNVLSSEHIVGSWKVLYSGSLTDPSLILYQVVKSLPFSKVSFGDLFVAISDGSTASSKCTVKIGDRDVDIVIDTKLEAIKEEGLRFKEIYSHGKIGGFSIPLVAEYFTRYRMKIQFSILKLRLIQRIYFHLYIPLDRSIILSPKI